MGDDERDIIEDESGSQEAAGNTSTSKIVKILLYVAGAIILVVVMIVISVIVSKSVTESRYQRDQDIIAAPPPEPLAVYELPAFTKATADAEPRFVKMTISLGYVPDVMLGTELVNRKNEIQHIVNYILQAKFFEDLNSVEKTITLSEEIKAHVNMRLISGKIKEVYFLEFVIN
jgi:flagellar basal body-associated protein FliL